MKIETLKLDQINPAEYNPRQITDGALRGLEESFKKFGNLQPIVVNQHDGKTVCISGHQRLKVLAARGETETQAIIVDFDEITEKAANVAMNSQAISGDWDEAGLEELLKELKSDLPEFDDLNFDEMAEDYELTDEAKDNKIPEEPENIVIKKGDLIELGAHRLLNGDSTDRKQVERLMDGEKANMVFTSPPYWVGFEYENEKDKVSILAHIDKSAYLMSLFVKGKIVINTGNINSITIAEKITGKKQPAMLIDWWRDALNKNNYLLRHIRIWAKTGGVIPSRRNDKIDMHWEYLATFTEESGNAGFIATFKNASDKTGQTLETPEWAVKGVWADIKGAARETGHCAAFPVELVTRYLIMYTESEMIDYEPYGGSGTTLIACEKLNRKCFGMEIDPGYCQIITQRWCDYTGNNEIKINGKKINWNEYQEKKNG